jgi:hypothetical protein
MCKFLNLNPTTKESKKREEKQKECCHVTIGIWGKIKKKDLTL